MKVFNHLLYKTFNILGYKIVSRGQQNNHFAELQTLFGVALSYKEYPYCHKGFKLLKDLKHACDAGLRINAAKHLELHFDNFIFEVNTWEEILILHEIFVSCIYNIQIGEDFLLIDIGLNVGFTSIYFSNNVNCKRIIAFEPFTVTMQAAQRNISLNPFAGKIELHSIGLGYPARSIEVDYSYEYKGSIGLNGIPAYTNNSFSARKVQLEMTDPSIALHDLLLTSELKKILKIDCEGAEYEIIKRLSETNLLQYADVILIEWHLNGPDELVKYLSKAGFKILSRDEHSATTGMLYAIK